VKLLVQQSAEIDAVDELSGNTPLHAAVSQGEVAEEVVGFLIKNRANVNAPSGYVLAHAVKVAETGSVVQLLLTSSAIVNNKSSYTHHFHAPWSPHIERTYSCDTCQVCPLTIAAAKGDSYKHLVQMLLNCSSDANAYSPYTGPYVRHRYNEFYHTPLDAALCNGDNAKEILKLLLDAGANFDIVDQGRAFSRGARAISEGHEVAPTLPSPTPSRSRGYDHIDILSWVMSPTKMGKDVRKTVHILRKAGIHLRFYGISKPFSSEWGGIDWLQKMDREAQVKLFQTAGLFDHLDGNHPVQGGPTIAPAWNLEDLQSELGRIYPPDVSSESEDDVDYLEEDLEYRSRVANHDFNNPDFYKYDKVDG
jgi:hypothetical protein